MPNDARAWRYPPSWSLYRPSLGVRSTNVGSPSIRCTCTDMLPLAPCATQKRAPPHPSARDHESRTGRVRVFALDHTAPCPLLRTLRASAPIGIPAMFGGNWNTQQQQQQQPQQQQSTGLFGQPAAQATGAFGQPAAAGGGIFGGTGGGGGFGEWMWGVCVRACDGRCARGGEMMCARCFCARAYVAAGSWEMCRCDRV